MKLTLSNVKELKRASTNPLTKHVCNYVIDRWGDYDNKRYIFTDVLDHGCQSGKVFPHKPVTAAYGTSSSTGPPGGETSSLYLCTSVR